MALKRKILAEYINQVREDLPGTCVHKRAENIIRGYDCQYLIVPKLESEPIFCRFHNIETSPNCFCCWAKNRPIQKDFWRNNTFLKIGNLND